MSLMNTCWSLLLLSAIALRTNCANAQITPDATLPNNSNVTINGSTFDITGGTQAGSNLFHSFQQFSVPTGGTALFNNAADIQNIFTRVTGGSVSNIDGIIRTSGTANLFLINPSGIIFGKNASLNIGGSFLASTASNLKFTDGSEFSAKVTQTTPLLTISVPTGLQFGETAGSISNQSTVYDRTSGNYGLVVQPGNTLALVGGNVSFEGGTLTAEGGRIELGGVTGSGRVDLSVNGSDLRLSFPNGIEQADVSLTKAMIIANSLNQLITNDDDFISVPVTPAGNIVINGRNINALESTLDASARANKTGRVGEIVLNATGTISVTGTAKNRSGVSSDGNRGVIKIKGKGCKGKKIIPHALLKLWKRRGG
jgi:filamentous hemagglutinin family protein